MEDILTNMCKWWPLWWILPAILGWLLGRAMMMKWKTRTEELEREVADWKSKYAKLEDELDACRKKRAELESDLALERGRIKEVNYKLKDLEDQNAKLVADAASKKSTASTAPPKVEAKATTAAAASSFAASKLTSSDPKQNLQIFEGIGPKMEEALHAGGIHSYADLANARADQLNGIVEAAGHNSGIHDTQAWIDQAKYGKSKDWHGLRKYQLGFGGGNEAKVDKYQKELGVNFGDAGESSGPKAAGEGKWAKLKTNNMQIIEGIGPKMDQVLNDNGISSWSVLAGKSFDELRAILDQDKYGDKYRIIDPSDWPAQARLAADGNWDGLIKHQSDDGSAAKARTVLIKLGILKEGDA